MDQMKARAPSRGGELSHQHIEVATDHILEWNTLFQFLAERADCDALSGARSRPTMPT